MRTLSNEDRERIKKISEEIFREEGTRKENMISAYVRHLPDKESKQGELMADRIYEIVANFHDVYEKAKDGSQGWMEKQFEEIEKEKQPKEQCEVYYKLVSDSIIGIQELTKEDAAKLLKQAESIYKQADISDEEKSRMLREMLQRVIEENGAIMQKFTQLLIEYTVENMTEEMMEDRVILEEQEQDLVAGMVMAAYIAAKEGKLEDISSNITLDEITILICMEYESTKIIQDAQNGRITWELAKGFLRLVGIVAMLVLCKIAFRVGLILISAIFGDMVLGSVFVPILSFIFVSSVVYGVARFARKGSDKLADQYIEHIAKPAADAIVFSFRVLVTGAKRLAEFLADVVKTCAEKLKEMNEEALSSVLAHMNSQSKRTEVNEMTENRDLVKV